MWVLNLSFGEFAALRSAISADPLELCLLDSEQRRKCGNGAPGQFMAAFDGHTEAIKRLALRNTGRFSGLSTQISVEEAIFGPLAATQGIA